MSSSTTPRRRTAGQITLPRASRLHRLVRLLTESPQRRDQLLSRLQMGLRTFYRELEFLAKLGLKVQRDGKTYRLKGTIEAAETRLPFPDPRLSFSEMAELARHPGPTAERLARLLASVVEVPPETPEKKPSKRKKTRTSTD